MSSIQTLNENTWKKLEQKETIVLQLERNVVAKIIPYTRSMKEKLSGEIWIRIEYYKGNKTFKETSMTINKTHFIKQIKEQINETI